MSLNAALGRVRVRAEIIRSGQTVPGVRELDDKIDKCEALASALATTVAIAIDPVRGLGPSPAVPTPPPEPLPHQDGAGAVEHVAPPLPGPEPGPPRPILFFAGAGGVFSLGVTPGAAFGAEASFGARRDAFSIDIAARIETMPDSVRAASGDRLEATVLSGTLSPCGQLGVFLGCIFGRVGAFQGRAPDVVTPSLATTVFGAVGLRAGVRLLVWRWISMQAMVEAGLPLVRTSLLWARLGDRALVFSGASVTGLPLVPINRTPLNTEILASQNYHVFASVNDDGTVKGPDLDCQAWTSASSGYDVSYGNCTKTSNWSSTGTAWCNHTARLYCFEQ